MRRNVTEVLLASLRRQSIYLIEENPFLSSNQSETFAKLKHRMEYRLQTRSTKEAFKRFWSLEYLSQNNSDRELAFFTNKSENFSSTLKQQIQSQATKSEIQVLLSDLLEEWKQNYVKNSQQRDPEETLAEAERIKAKIVLPND